MITNKDAKARIFIAKQKLAAAKQMEATPEMLKLINNAIDAKMARAKVARIKKST